MRKTDGAGNDAETQVHTHKPMFTGEGGGCLFVWSYSRPYVHDGFFGLSHVRNDAVCDDEQHEVLGAVLHRRRIPADSQEA